jgi:hypothetical protein
MDVHNVHEHSYYYYCLEIYEVTIGASLLTGTLLTT